MQKTIPAPLPWMNVIPPRHKAPNLYALLGQDTINEISMMGASVNASLISAGLLLDKKYLGAKRHV